MSYMETYYTLDEKYLQAVDEMNNGEQALSLKLLNEILAEDPLYVRAHYQIGCLYYYDLLDYQSAGYHFKLCTEREASFPDVYIDYIDLLVFLNKEKLVYQTAEKALVVPGVNAAEIQYKMGRCAEGNKQWKPALNYYFEGLMLVTDNDTKRDLEEGISRVNFKLALSQKIRYSMQSE